MKMMKWIVLILFSTLPMILVLNATSEDLVAEDTGTGASQQESIHQKINGTASQVYRDQATINLETVLELFNVFESVEEHRERYKDSMENIKIEVEYASTIPFKRPNENLINLISGKHLSKFLSEDIINSDILGSGVTFLTETMHGRAGMVPVA